MMEKECYMVGRQEDVKKAGTCLHRAKSTFNTYTTYFSTLWRGLMSTDRMSRS